MFRDGVRSDTPRRGFGNQPEARRPYHGAVTATPYERHLGRAHGAMTRRMRSAAGRLAAEITGAPVTAAAQRTLRSQAAAALARRHEAFAAGFDETLRQSFEAFLRPPAPKPSGQWLDLGALEILDDRRIEDEIEIAQIVQVLGEACGVELRRLIKFEEALRRSEGVRVAASPIGPPGLARALWAGSEALGLPTPARAEAVRAAARWFAPRLSEIYAAVRQAGFADASHLEAADRAAAQEAADEGATIPRSTGFDVTRPGALYELLDLDDQRPVFAATEAPPLPPVADTQPLPLHGDDARIPDLIHSHREELAALQGMPSARLVVALIGHLFAQIVADAALAPEARAWIGRLEPAVVRLATEDASLLQSHRHPVWTLVNRIATPLNVAKGPPPPEFLQWLAATVDQLLAEPTAAAFAAAGERLTQWQRQQAQQRLTGVEGALDVLRRNASQEEIVARARARLERRLDSAQPPKQVRRFVLTLWTLVLAQEIAATPRGPGAPRTSPAMDTAADLIWSTDAARSRADAATLVSLVPALVERLTAGMATVQLSDAIRAAWLEQLAAIHLHVLRRPTGTAPTTGPVTVDLELDDELPAAAAPAPAPVDPSDPLGGLQVGDTVDMQLHGDWTGAQLLWMSDNGQFLLFSDTVNGGSHSFTRTALRKMLEQGLLRTSEARSALERASDQIIRRRH
jgi:hypothetical protein